MHRIRARAKKFADMLDRTGEQYFCLYLTGAQPPTADFRFRITNPGQIAALLRVVAQQDKALQIVLDHIVKQANQEAEAKAAAAAKGEAKKIILWDGKQ